MSFKYEIRFRSDHRLTVHRKDLESNVAFVDGYIRLPYKGHTVVYPASNIFSVDIVETGE